MKEDWKTFEDRLLAAEASMSVENEPPVTDKELNDLTTFFTSLAMWLTSAKEESDAEVASNVLIKQHSDLKEVFKKAHINVKEVLDHIWGDSHRIGEFKYIMGDILSGRNGEVLSSNDACVFQEAMQRFIETSNQWRIEKIEPKWTDVRKLLQAGIEERADSLSQKNAEKKNTLIRTYRNNRLSIRRRLAAVAEDTFYEDVIDHKQFDDSLSAVAAIMAFKEEGKESDKFFFEKWLEKTQKRRVVVDSDLDEALASADHALDAYTDDLHAKGYKDEDIPSELNVIKEILRIAVNRRPRLSEPAPNDSYVADTLTPSPQRAR